MKKINKILLLVVAIVLIIPMAAKAYMFELEISLPDNISDNTILVGDEIELISELVTSNDLIDPDDPNSTIGEIGREDVTDTTTWYSSNDAIARIEGKKIVAVAPGEVTITGVHDENTSGERSDEITITVLANSVVSPPTTNDDEEPGTIEVNVPEETVNGIPNTGAGINQAALLFGILSIIIGGSAIVLINKKIKG